MLFTLFLFLAPGAAASSPPPPHDCPACCFELLGASGCPGSFDCNNCPMGLDDYVNVKRDFGAIGNYGVDDTLAIQKAINFCKKTQRGLFFPSGVYVVTAALDFGAWQGILVTGGVPGANGIAGSGATVQLQANLNTTQSACFDFSGSAYGSVSGIAFGGSNCKVRLPHQNCLPAPGFRAASQGSAADPTEVGWGGSRGCRSLSSTHASAARAGRTRIAPAARSTAPTSPTRCMTVCTNPVRYAVHPWIDTVFQG